ncbi:MAG: VanZ family protein [Clostridia bacterium]|nr:VanZ family protein [Clostridia bacterium]
MKSALNFLYSFIYDGLPVSLLFVPIYLFLRLVFLTNHKQKNLADRINFYREIIMLCFFVFMVHLFVQTFIVNIGANQINLIPFKIIIQQIQEMSLNQYTYGIFILNIIGNVTIFAPIGIFAPYLFKTDFRHTALLGFLISLTIEGGQLPLPRTSDVDDLILNTTGTIVGYGIYMLGKNLKDIKN